MTAIRNGIAATETIDSVHDIGARVKPFSRIRRRCRRRRRRRAHNDLFLAIYPQDSQYLNFPLL